MTNIKNIKKRNLTVNYSFRPLGHGFASERKQTITLIFLVNANTRGGLVEVELLIPFDAPKPTENKTKPQRIAVSNIFFEMCW